jgi:hypothetical protein
MTVRLFAMLGSALLIVSASAQDHPPTHSSRPKAATAPVRVIDGSKTPDEIPHASAWRLFLRAFSESAGPETKVARAKTDAIGLDPADAAVFRSTIAEFHIEVSRLEQQIQSFGRAGPATAAHAEIARLRMAINRLAVDVQNSLEAGLSRDGAKRLRDFVHAQRKHMKVVQLPAARDKEDLK